MSIGSGSGRNTCYEVITVAARCEQCGTNRARLRLLIDGGQSLCFACGNRWAADVIPLLDQPRMKEVALLFPAEMSFFEPPDVDTEGRHRMDLLGWYAQFVDLGWHVDIVHPTQIAAGALRDYRILVVPHNSLYELGENSALETAVRQFVTAGGTVLHGPSCDLAKRALGIVEEPIAFDCIKWTEELIPHGWSTVAYGGGDAHGTYIQSGRAAIAESRIGNGRVLSFGFEYGYAYSRRTTPIVPSNYGRREMHPIVLIKNAPVAALVGTSPNILLPPTRGVECARFGQRIVIVNHRPSPVDISGIVASREIAQLHSDGGLAGHSAIYLEL